MAQLLTEQPFRPSCNVDKITDYKETDVLRIHI
jgi:hypothetical protein